MNVDKSEDCGCVAELIKRIIELRNLGSTQDGEYALVNNSEVKWANLFMEFILGTAFCKAETCQAHSDDMIWYVHQVKINSSFYLCHSQSNLVQVYRRSSKNQPSPCDQSYNWEETVCLNLILQQLDFYVTCAVCTQTGPQNLEIIRKNNKKVYPSPSRRRMDSKGESEEITYPKLYFAIDGFEEASNTWHWAQKLVKQGGRRHEFVGMRGPHKKGYAEMAVTRVPNCGYETPLSENNMDFSELASMEHSLNRRRMSETNLAGPKLFTRSSILPSSHTSQSRRWQSETDTVNQYPEVEGSNIDEGVFISSLSSGLIVMLQMITLYDRKGSYIMVWMLTIRISLCLVLDEGVLTRLWSKRGFGQAWHWLREKKRAECTPLNAYLTYVTLSWTSILKGAFITP
ncbi:hypothetical protein DICVIV_12866 [Dictyocaulus viviparus]|uniref:Uncharacterized protein n=1 Tax=Dictyocaulus viviparus TaxID=29172 RepID=A0A0D8XBL6_DICVI|nr:hypothetical protein DICVIV_12866 [Dictyocaulus viviparus]